MTRGEALSHLNIQYVWLPLHKKSLEHSWFGFVFFSHDGHFIKSWVELCFLKRDGESREKNVNQTYMTKIQCCFLLARLEVGFVSGDWHKCAFFL